MKRIGMTQRVEVVEGYNERRDCLDQQWAHLLISNGYCPVPLSNIKGDVADYIDACSLSGIILTGGNDISTVPGAQNAAPERDHFEQQVLAIAIERQLPLIGVCRGMQLINLYFGGRLEKVEAHVASRHSITWLPNRFYPEQILEVNSYHNFGIPRSALADGLEAMALASDGSIEALTHPTLPLIGMMWHPERETLFQKQDVTIFKTLFEG